MGQSSREERLTDKGSSAQDGRDREERKPEGIKPAGGTGKGLEKEHSLPGDPASPGGTGLCLQDPATAAARWHGRKQRWTQKRSTQTPQQHIHKWLLKPRWCRHSRGAGKRQELLLTEQRRVPEQLSSACPTPRAGHREANQHCRDHQPGQHGCSSVPPAAHQLARRLWKPRCSPAPPRGPHT